MEGLMTRFHCTKCMRWIDSANLSKRGGHCYCGAIRHDNGTWHGGQPPAYHLVGWNSLSARERQIVGRHEAVRRHPESYAYEFIDGQLVFYQAVERIYSRPIWETDSRPIQAVARFGHGKAVHILTMHSKQLVALCGASKSMSRPVTHAASGPATCKRCLAAAARAAA